MGTWYDVTSKGRPQASWQLPSSEGGGYGYSLLVVVVVKLLHAVYAMLKHRQPYNPSRLLVALATIRS